MTIKARHLALLALCILLGVSLFDINATTAAGLFILAGIILVVALRRPENPIPSVLIVVVAFLAGYASPVLLFPATLDGLSQATVDLAMQWALRCFIVFSLGYVVVNRRRDSAIAHPHARGRNQSSALFALLAIGSLSIFAWFANAAMYGIHLTFIAGQDFSAGNDTVQQILELMIDLKYSYILAYVLLRNERRPSRPYRWILYGVLATALVDIISIGSKGAIMRLVAAAVLGMLLAKSNQLHWKKILGGMLAAVVCILSFYIITQYRQVMHAAYASGQNIDTFSTRYDIFKQSMVSSLQPDQPSGQRVVDANDIGSRLGSGTYGLGWTLQLTHEQPPYENAVNSLLAPVYAVLPRALFPGKPIFMNSGRFATEYFGWAYGGISISLPGSFYYAWGYPGMLAGMLALGIGLGLLAARIKREGFTAIRSIVCFTIITLYLLDTGAEFQPFLTSLTRALLLLVFVHIVWRVLVSRSTLGYGNHGTRRA